MTGEETIDKAKRLVLATFKDFDAKAIEQALRLCLRVGGVIVDEGFVMAWFRYWPAQGELVADMDFDALEKLNLAGGPMLHGMVCISPFPSLSLIREFLRAQNPWGVTCHRYDAETKTFRFAAQKHRQWNRAEWEAKRENQ